MVLAAGIRLRREPGVGLVGHEAAADRWQTGRGIGDFGLELRGLTDSAMGRLAYQVVDGVAENEAASTVSHGEQLQGRLATILHADRGGLDSGWFRVRAEALEAAGLSE